MVVADIANPAEIAKLVRADILEPRGFPVDPAWIAHQMGLRVLDAELPEKVSGALVKRVGEDPVILLNKSDSRNRKRFSCAHELGHYAYRTANSADHYEFIDFRDDQSTTGTNSEEIFANQFAAELLMPGIRVRQLSEKGAPSLLIAKYFGVSDDAIRVSLKILGISG